MSAVVFQGWDSRNHKATDQAVAMDSYQNYFRRLDIFLSRKQQGAIRADQFTLFFSTIFYGGNDFQSSYITFDIFNNWTFFDTVEKTNEK